MGALSLRFGVGVLGLSLLASGNACGHSLRQLRTADVYFERCYGGERDERYSDAERRDCWEAWLAHYTAEQSDERVSYARERLILLDPDRRALIELATGEGEAGAESEAESHAAAEPSAPESEPPVVLTGRHEAEDALEADAAPHHRPTLPRSSTAHCDTSCLPPWEACVDACEDRDRSCYGACRQSYRICSAACY